MQLADNTDGHVHGELLAGQHLPDPSHLLPHLVLTTALGVDMPDKQGNGGSKKRKSLARVPQPAGRAPDSLASPDATRPCLLPKTLTLHSVNNRL